jgi:methylmalonyl-CoA/ethylmalonyl-CoA epimerase
MVMPLSNRFQFHHLGVAVDSISKVLSTYETIFGYHLLSGPFDDPIQKSRVCFVGTGVKDAFVIELVEPLAQDSPVKNMVAKGIAAYHVCYEVEDIDKVVAEVSQMGCVVVSPPQPAVAFQQRRIAWFYTPTRQLIEVLEKCKSNP